MPIPKTGALPLGYNPTKNKVPSYISQEYLAIPEKNAPHT